MKTRTYLVKARDQYEALTKGAKKNGKQDYRGCSAVKVKAGTYRVTFI